MKLLFILLLLMSSCGRVLFEATGIEGPEGMGYIYQPINGKGIPTRMPDLYFCKDCELELRGKRVYLKDTNIEITDENTESY